MFSFLFPQTYLLCIIHTHAYVQKVHSVYGLYNKQLNGVGRRPKRKKKKKHTHLHNPHLYTATHKNGIGFFANIVAICVGISFSPSQRYYDFLALRIFHLILTVFPLSHSYILLCTYAHIHTYTHTNVHTQYHRQRLHRRPWQCCSL